MTVEMSLRRPRPCFVRFGLSDILGIGGMRQQPTSSFIVSSSNRLQVVWEGSFHFG